MSRAPTARSLPRRKRKRRGQRETRKTRNVITETSTCVLVDELRCLPKEYEHNTLPCNTIQPQSAALLTLDDCQLDRLRGPRWGIQRSAEAALHRLGRLLHTHPPRNIVSVQALAQQKPQSNNKHTHAHGHQPADLRCTLPNTN